MAVLLRTCLLVFSIIVSYTNIINCENLSVKISASEHVNLVSDRFLSFTVDPKLLFENDAIGKDCVCMASSLSPSYIRIAGPSTSVLDFQNSSLLFDSPENGDGILEVDLEMWKRFAEWAKLNNLELVFALNNEVKNKKGLWDPQTTLDILTAAEQVNITDVVWQLGYECHNSTVDTYYSELDTLRVILDTSFPRSRELGWKIAASDASGCLDQESGDFMQRAVAATKYVDAILFNGKATAKEMDKLTPEQRADILGRLSKTHASIWITDHREDSSLEMEQAAEWLADLGYCALSGFDVHFRELRGSELFEPSLSFYMSLLYKNLVGRRVLDVNIDGSDAIDAVLFAHCTTLKSKPVPGAVTLYGVNMDEQVTRFSIKLSKREEGGDIMQFIISQDRNGNTIVNGHPMFHEGDIKPVVKRVRPYRTLLVSLPPKSFGFWVLANTKIEACLDTNEVYDHAFIPATTVDDISDRMTITRKDLQRIKRETPKNKAILPNPVKNNEVIFKQISENDEKIKLVDHMMTLKWTDAKFWKLASEFMKKELPLKSMTDLHKYIRELLIELYNNSSSQRIKHFLSDNGISQELISEILSVRTRQKRQSLAVQLKNKVSELRNQIYKPILPKNNKEQTTVPNNVLQPIINRPSRLSVSQAKIKSTVVNNNNKAEATKNSKKQNDVRKKPTDDIQSRVQMVGNARSRMLALITKLKDRRTKSAEVLSLAKRSTEDLENILPMPKPRFARAIVQVSPQPTHANINELNDTIKDILEIQKIGENPGKINIELFKELINTLNHIKLGSFVESDELDESHNEIDHGEDFPKKNNEIPKETFGEDAESLEDQIIVKTKISDEDASISVDEKSNQEGILKKVVGGLPTVIELFKEKLSQLWNLISAFE